MGCINSHKKFRARSGSPFKQEEAQVIGETLDEIRMNNDGKLKPEFIVSEAKKKSNPLHKHFEWDDTICGEQYRLSQARSITNHLVEYVTIDGDEETEIRSFFSVDTEEGNVYVSKEDAITNVDYRKQLLDQMITTMENLTTNMKLFRRHDYKD